MVVVNSKLMMIKQEIKDKIISLKKKGVSCPDIINITGVSRSTIMKLSRYMKLTNEHNDWSQEEIDFLRINYPIRGLKFCAEKLNRSGSSIGIKACKINIVSGISQRNSKKRRTLQKLDRNKILCECKKHGICVHYDWLGISLVCQLCQQQKNKNFNITGKGREYYRKYKNRKNQNPINNLANRLRSLVYQGIKRISKNNTKTIGCFRNLDYTPLQLNNYIENIKKLQNNCCPVCKRNYNQCIISIDHVIPLKTANTEQEIINLFDLKNLNLMCKNCNSSKNDNNFNKWLGNKDKL